MSVAAIINKPKTEEDKKFYIPVASERFFNRCWKKAIYELNLDTLAEIEYGLEFSENELSTILKELERIKEWGKQNLEEEDKKLIISRIELLITKLPEAFKSKNIVVYIG